VPPDDWKDPAADAPISNPNPLIRRCRVLPDGSICTDIRLLGVVNRLAPN
jgi:hypothetical protein